MKKEQRYLQEKFGTRNILRLWRSGNIERCGEVIDGIEYELHGIGCAIYFPTDSVDFDYGSNNRIDSFDEWRLYIYATDRPLRYKKYTNMKFLERESKTYIDARRIKKMSPSDDLYVLIDPHEHSENQT